MKENVDLTEDRVFRKKLMAKNGLKRDRLVSNFEEIILERVCDDIELSSDYKDIGVIYQGDRKVRKKKKMSASFSDGIHCDCCYSKIYVYDNSTLCRKCIENYRNKDILSEIKNMY